MREAAVILLCIFVGGSAGIYLSLKLKCRRDSLSRIINMLCGIEQYISVGSFSLAEIFDMLNKSGCDVIDCLALSESAKDGRFSDKFADIAESLPELKQEDRDILKAYGDRAGKSDKQGQISLIRLTVNGLSEQLKAAKSEYDGKGRLYRRLGVLLGAMTAVMLL